MDRISEFDQALDLPAGCLGVYSGRGRIKSNFDDSVPIAQGKSNLLGTEQHKAEQEDDFCSVVNGWVLANYRHQFYSGGTLAKPGSAATPLESFEISQPRFSQPLDDLIDEVINL